MAKRYEHGSSTAKFELVNVSTASAMYNWNEPLETNYQNFQG